MFDVGFEQVFGNYTFPIGTVEYSKFFSSKYLAREDGSGKHVLGLRSQMSVAGGNAPVFERFYAGGIRSFRGFTFRGVGPFENNLAVGGTFAWLNTVEYQIPLLANDKRPLGVLRRPRHGGARASRSRTTASRSARVCG